MFPTVCSGPQSPSENENVLVTGRNGAFASKNNIIVLTAQPLVAKYLARGLIHRKIECRLKPVTPKTGR